MLNAQTGASGRTEFPLECLLVCEARSESIERGHWQFTLENADGSPILEASDEEFGDLNRLSLLAAVRGLEAIDGAAVVTLLSHSRYLIRSLTDSLPRWRESGFVWEHFGRRMQVQHADLWRRVDRALTFHHVHACLVSARVISRVPDANPAPIQRRVDPPHESVPAPRGRSQDRLRSWLLGGPRREAGSARNRFSEADLAESA